jgi:hypothetical protein
MQEVNTSDEWSQADMEDMIRDSILDVDPAKLGAEMSDRWYNRKAGQVTKVKVEHRQKLLAAMWKPCIVGSDVLIKDQEEEAIATGTIAQMEEQVRRAIEGYREVANARKMLWLMHYQR